MLAVVLLIISNIFMTFAWYGHLTGKKIFGLQLPDTHTSLVVAILVSWGIAFVEYCFQVPANRIGSSQFTFAQLKTMQEVITLIVFAGFSYFFLNEPLRWNHWVGFSFLCVAAFFIYKK